MASPQLDPALVSHLKELYASYRHTKNIDAKGAFFSPSCYQICRPKPSFAARDRETIVRYLHETAPKRSSLSDEDTGTLNSKGYYTIRPLTDAEHEFGTDEHVFPAGFSSAEDVKAKARSEGWVGMRVDLWDEPVVAIDKDDSLMVKVQYWWRKEEGGWLQIFHDIKYLGSKDGSQGAGGEILE
ncbi:monocarboxylate permease-like protein [Colletotrichum sp. SAR11_59]|nr:monocarboxylate permease-like protein [Colletotrichum sp. SAR11_59]